MFAGVAAPMALYQVFHPSGAQGRLDIVTSRGLTPLVGRDREVNTLLHCWQHIRNGSGHVVILSGEAGIGKSRLLQSLTDHIAYEPHTVLECRCSPYHHQSPWHPISDLFRRVLNWQQHTTPEERVAALEHWLAQSQLNLTEAVPLFATLLALPLPADRYPLLALPPQEQRQKILEGLLAYVGALAAQKPLLVIVEDLHWCDPSTLEWLHYLIDHGPMVPFMLCLTCRPTFHPPWGWRAHMTPLIVDHLPADQTTNMVWHLTGGKALPPTVMQHIITTTNGVPLFIEEMAQMFLESELLDEVDSQYTLRVPLSTLSIPHTLQDLLMARLDQLGAAKRTVQLGAVIGRQFSYALLQAVSPLDPETLHRDLERAVKAELLYQRGLPPRATYLFKHALIQEAAYQSLLRRTRQQHHAQIAQKLATDFRDTVETQPQIVAHHYTEAGLGKEALPYWQQAGQLAIERSALSEVIGHLTMGLTVLKTLPDTLARAQQELRLLTTLGPTLIATKGHSALEVEQAYTRARTLCERVGENQQLFLVLNGLRRLYFMRGQIQQAQECGEQLLAVAQRQGQPAQLIEAHLALAQLLTARGEFIAAYTQHQQGFALYDPARHRATPTLYPRDTAVTMHANHGQLLSALGYADQAQEWLSQALTLAQDLDHPFSQAVTLVYAAELHLGRGESLVAGEKATAALALCAEHGLTLFAARATLLRGIALTEQGQSTTGIQLISEGLGALRAQKAEVALLALLPFIAETYRKLGHSEEGYALVTEALTSVEHTGARRWEAELYRLQGEFLLARSSPHIQQAETCFQHALALARRQHAKRAELRAAMSLARLWQQQSRREEARRLLAEVYAWFAEGFDTADLQEARAVLADLA